MTINKKAIIAMSGGVDSSVAAALLKEQGYQVEGIFMKLGIEGDEESEKSARAVADKLKIKFSGLDLSKEFKKKVIDYFVAEYKNGRTPNPCVMCNREIKFGILMDKILEMGADFMATGHYVRLRREIPNPKSQIPKFGLLKAKDESKDQSYFLYNLTQEKLKRCLFPLGNYVKIEVRRLAEKYELPILEGDESQEICFIESKRYRDFLKKRLKLVPGDIVDADNDKIGHHQGLPLYTIGQRRDIGIGGTGPYYVVKIDFGNNKLTVSDNFSDPALYSKKLIAEEVNWIAGKEPKLPLKVKAKIRYRSKEALATVRRDDKNKYQITFKTPQRAITPGQSAVFYLEEEIIGGGVILS